MEIWYFIIFIIPQLSKIFRDYQTNILPKNSYLKISKKNHSKSIHGENFPIFRLTGIKKRTYLFELIKLKHVEFFCLLKLFFNEIKCWIRKKNNCGKFEMRGCGHFHFRKFLQIFDLFNFDISKNNSIPKLDKTMKI